MGFDTGCLLSQVGNERIAHPLADCLSFSITARCSFTLAFEAQPAVTLSEAGDSSRGNILFFLMKGSLNRISFSPDDY